MSAPSSDAPFLSSVLEIRAADVIRLIQGHLTSVGLHESNRVLREESGIGAAGVPRRGMLKTWATQGQWHLVLRALSMMDRECLAAANKSSNLIARVHEMAILEVADAGDLQVAYSLFRFAQSDLESSLVRVSGTKEKITRARHVEQKLAALAAARTKDPKVLVPDNFYGISSSRDQIRKELGEKLESEIPEQPGNRLVSLLQQAIKYQSYTGALPSIQEYWPVNDEDDEKEKETPKKKKRKVFDFVLGTTTQSEAVMVADGTARHMLPIEHMPANPMGTVKFGKKAVCESASFLPDGSGLVTGSSDGLIEIWDAAHNFETLRTDLPYQQREELLGHAVAVTALAVSNDGTLLASGDERGNVRIWRIDTGKCLRQLTYCHSQAISALHFSPDGSHVLTASQDGKCREFGLRTSRMLKEFAGHESYVNACSYLLHPTAGLRVLTASADGNVRIFDGSSADCLKILRPPSSVSSGGSTSATKMEGISIVVDAPASVASTVNDAIVGLSLLHNPAQTMIVVPRSVRAFLVNVAGVVLKVYEDNTANESPFCAAAVSASNKWLYIVKEDGHLCIFDIQSAKLEGSIPDFGLESTKKTSKDSGDNIITAADITALLSHPNRNIVAAFSNDKRQKRGQLVIWK